MDRQGKDHVKFSGATISNDSSVYLPAKKPTAYLCPEAPSSTLLNHVGQKSDDVFQLKQRSCIDLSRVKISEVMKSSSFDNAATQSLLSVIYGILEESIERRNGEIPQRVAGILRKVVQEIERRICTQKEHLRTQSSLFKAREEKYQSRIKVLEALATGTSEETKIVTAQLQQIKSEKSKLEEKTKGEELNAQRVMKDKEVEFQSEMKQKEEDLHRMEEKKQQHLQKLVQEIEQQLLNVQRVMKDKEEEFQRVTKQKEEVVQGLLKEKEQRLVQAKDKDFQDVQRLMKDKEEEFQKVMKQKEEDLLLDVQRVMKVKEEEFQRLMKQKEEDEQGLVKEKEQSIVQEKEQQGLLDVQRMMKDKEAEFLKVMKQKDNDVQRMLHGKDQDLEKLAQELQRLKLEKEQDLQRLEEEEKRDMQRLVQEKEQDTLRLMKEKDELNNEMVNLRKIIEATKEECEQQTLKTKEEAGVVQQELELRLKETVGLLTESRNRVKELEALSESVTHRWNKKQHVCQLFTDFQLGALRELRVTSQSIQQDLVKTKTSYSEDFSILSSRFQVLDNAAKSYYSLLAENQKIHNELQDLKGNIRVYCRIRPFLPGQKSKQSISEYIGENGELVITNPSKPGKEGRRSFKFKKVYGPSATQAEVFADTKPLIQSVLDGYNVCIFAYGQTGSGKTYTMMGPDGGTEEEWGVNYRALKNLFHISQGRESSFTYEISVQMVEIYNEQVRDLLSNDGAQKRLGIMSASQAGQSSGLAVPDASIHPVSSTSAVLDLINVGQNNRAKSATAMNERSSRSHSVLSIHIRGADLKSGSALRGSLHLVDLAGSERVDRSEVTGDRLKEAQHINKSLSALGDVIFALAQKSSHIPYRNSKLTQVLQSSLGGQAKTLMFVQINPDAVSYTESLSTLKFAERVSGVELGAAKSSKDGRDIRELMEQVASLKETVAKKDEEIGALQQLQSDSKNTAA